MKIIFLFCFEGQSSWLKMIVMVSVGVSLDLKTAGVIYACVEEDGYTMCDPAMMSQSGFGTSCPIFL